MKRIMILTAVAAMAAGATGGTIESTVIRQQWPWQKDVRIDYMLTGAWGEANDVEVTVKSGDTVIEKSTAAFAGAFTGDLYEVANGSRTIWWHPDVARHGAVEAKKLTFTLTPKTVVAKGNYMIIDLADESHYTVTYRNDVPEGGWNKSPWEHFRTKLVLRRIRAGKFMMGSPTTEVGRMPDDTKESDLYNENLHEVTITKDFWLGIFQLSLAQVRKIWPLIAPSGDTKTYELGGKTYNRVSSYTTDLNYAARPIGLFELLGTNSVTAWPQKYSVDVDSICGKLAARTAGENLDAGYIFTLPTEAQWEYACRAGTQTAYYNGYDPEVDTAGNDPHLDLIARYRYSKASGGGQWDGPANFAPNAWGLYDMLGDNWEMTMDVANWDFHGLGFKPVVDPRCSSYVPKNNRYTVIRGGGWNAAKYCRAAARKIGPYATGDDKGDYTCRIAFVCGD